MRRAAALLLFCAACGGTTVPPPPRPAHVSATTATPSAPTTPPPSDGPPAEWTAWRAQRHESLAGEEGWLTLIGLWWLGPGGDMNAGSDPHAHVQLPHTAPGFLGAFSDRGGRMHFEAGANAVVTSNGVRVTGVDMVSDANGATPTVLACGSLRFWAIERAGRLGLRMKDRDSAARRDFPGVPVYDYDPRLRVRAHVVPPSPPRHLTIVNVLGMSEQEPCVGVLHFALDGAERTLAAVANGPRPEDGLSVMIRDATSDVETYGAGRYLDLPPPDANGDVWLDFNFLYTPPCAFTDFATCPLPPSENVLPVPIRAGERYVVHH